MLRCFLFYRPCHCVGRTGFRSLYGRKRRGGEGASPVSLLGRRAVSGGFGRGDGALRYPATVSVKRDAEGPCRELFVPVFVRFFVSFGDVFWRRAGSRWRACDGDRRDRILGDFGTFRRSVKRNDASLMVYRDNGFLGDFRKVHTSNPAGCKRKVRPFSFVSCARKDGRRCFRPFSCEDAERNMQELPVADPVSAVGNVSEDTRKKTMHGHIVRASFCLFRFRSLRTGVVCLGIISRSSCRWR